jgi:hypothetical protein
VALLSLLLLLRQLGLFVTHCAPVRRWLDARTPSGLLPLTTLVWTLLNVPLATAAVATTALVPLPKSKKSVEFCMWELPAPANAWRCLVQIDASIVGSM